jgi:hypothetical protein
MLDVTGKYDLGVWFFKRQWANTVTTRSL